MPNVAFIHPELKKVIKKYILIQDCIEGDFAVKRRKTAYLPQPNSTDDSPENTARYDAYLKRAVFYNVTQRTLSGLVGEIFTKKPTVVVPSQLKIVAEDAEGSGVSIEQLSKRATVNVLSNGRAGLLVDYPITEEPATLLQIEQGDIRPTIKVYKAHEVNNWRISKRGAKQVLSKVVLREKYVLSDDGFEIKEAYQWRVFELTEEGCSVSIYKSDKAITVSRLSDYYEDDFEIKIQNSEVSEGPYYLRDSTGAILTEIPFTFIGCENNDASVDLPPMYDLAVLNIAHYINSADYEEACFIIGQPTPWASGLTEEWVEKVLKGVVAIGSRGIIPLPEGGQMGLLQVEPNTMAYEAMQHKERQMTALGAKLVEQKTVQRTATEASIESASESSVLISSAQNVAAAFTFALKWCARFVGVAETGIEFKLHTDFDFAKMTPAERLQLIKEWQAEAISFTEMREGLRGAGVATLEDNVALEEIQKEVDEETARMIKEQEALQAITPDNTQAAGV